MEGRTTRLCIVSSLTSPMLIGGVIVVVETQRNSPFATTLDTLGLARDRSYRQVLMEKNSAA